MNIKVHMIRHGLTQGNINRCFYGAADVPLIEEGIAKIKENAAKGIYPVPDTHLYYTSGMRRTEQTFHLIYGDRKHGVLDALKERRFGDYEMRRADGTDKDPIFNAWLHDRFGSEAPKGGEAIWTFQDRVTMGMKDFIKKIAGENAGAKEVESVIVCHGGVISAILANKHAIDLTTAGLDAYRWVPETGRGYTLFYEGNNLMDFQNI